MNRERYRHYENTFASIHRKLKTLKVSEGRTDINILLLGETGVGKSTFINAFFNYLSYPTLEKARAGKFKVVIPTQFNIADENFQERIIRIGTDDNESVEVGASATQACRSYVYPVHGSDCRIRLIDTPGIGDTRGIERDSVNFDNVLYCIEEFEYLNAICILLKPDNCRLTVMFEFCIKQLLSKFEKSASRNLLFLFTNTRSSFYRPGETLPALRRLLGTIDGVEIPCDVKNIFCTDNESFRCLVALKNNIQFSSVDVDNFSLSWSRSHQECFRMITYVVGDDAVDAIALSPHKVQNTISVNSARRLIIQLSQPLAEIAQLIQGKIRALHARQEDLKCSNVIIAELRKKLYVPVKDVKVTSLNEPIIVCTSTKCSDVYQVGTKEKWHYRQKCHAPCELRNVTTETIGSPELSKCVVMNENGECSKCSCRYQLHMHLYYETTVIEMKVEDESIKSKITSNQDAWESTRNLVLKMSKMLIKLTEEKDAIIKAIAKFACFLKMNAITAYNDAYEAYLQYLIDREKSMGEAADANSIKQLETMMREYVEEKNVIMKAIAESQDDYVTEPEEIMNCVQSLYSLENVGAKIKEMFEAQNQSRKNETQPKEFVFESDFVKNHRGRGMHPEPNKPISSYVFTRSDTNCNSSNRLSNYIGLHPHRSVSNLLKPLSFPESNSGWNRQNRGRGRGKR